MLKESSALDTLDSETALDAVETIADISNGNEHDEKAPFRDTLDEILEDLGFQYMQAIPEYVRKIEETAMRMASIAEIDEESLKTPYYYLGLSFCAELYDAHGIYALDSFIQKLDESEKPEFVERMYNRLQYSMYDDLDRERYLASNMLFKLSNTISVTTIISHIPEYIYTLDEKSVLTALTTDNEWDRSKILQNIRFLPPELAEPIVVNILKYHYSFDIDDFYRSSSFPRTNRKLEREESSEENLVSVLDKKIATLYSAEDRETIDFTLQIIESVIEKGIIEKIGDVDLGKVLQESVKELDPTSKPFEIYHERFNKSREIPDFKYLLKERILNYYKNSLVNRYDVNIYNLNDDTLELLADSLKLYNEVGREVCPLLKEVNAEVDKEIFTNGAWFSGRDGIPMHLAVKASHWGENLGERWAYKDVIQPQIDQNPELRGNLIELAKNERKSLGIDIVEAPVDELLAEGLDLYYAKDVKLYDLLKCAAISRLLIENTESELYSGHLERFKTYLIDLGVTTNMLALDTGYSGSVIYKTIKHLYGDKEYSEEDVLERILLITSRLSVIRGIVPEVDRSDEAGKIERLPKKNQRTMAIEEGQPVFFPSKPDIQHLSWVVDHAIMRNFAPRKE